MTHRILIFPSGMCSIKEGKYVEFGNGHVVRCLNLAREIARMDPETEITLGVSGPEAEIARKLIRGGFSIVEVPLVTRDSPYWHYDFRLRFETNLVRFLEPSIVISDTHAEGLIAAKYNSCKCVAILDLPPIEFFHVYAMLADQIFVPLLESAYQLQSSIVAKSNFVGPMIDSASLSSAQMKTAEELREKIGLQKSFILVYLSRIHSDRKNFVDVIQEAFRLILEKHPEIALVMIGPGASHEETDPTLDVLALDLVENIHEYVKASSAFITRSPIIAMEALNLGVIPIVIPISDDRNQSTMGQSLGRYVTHLTFEDVVPAALAAQLEESILGNCREHLTTTSSREFVSGNGTAATASKILELVNTN